MYALILELMGKGMRYEFTSREIRIGRDPNCDLVLPTGEYPMVSRSHLLIRLAAERYWVEDLNTPGGTFVNGAQVLVSPLSDGDVLRLGVDGPELRASIVASYRLKSSETPPPRQSASDEASTWFRREAPAHTSQEAPNAGIFTFAAGSSQQAPPEVVPIEKPASEERLPAVTPEVQRDETPHFKIPAEPGPDQAASAPAPDRAATGAAKTKAALRDTVPPKNVPVDSAISTPAPAAEVKSTTDTTTMAGQLKTIRNLVVVALLLIVALWFVVLYHMRG